jgi:hypothetical protein
MVNLITENSYDVFLSYRRRTAGAEARLIRSDLSQHGIRVFMDVTDLGKGHFDDSLLNRISVTPNFVVVLAPHALDSRRDKTDWLRVEIAHAIASKCNIVPVMLPGFRFPEELPADIADVLRYQGVEYSHTFFDAMIGRILELVRSPPFTEPTPREPTPEILEQRAISKFSIGLRKIWLGIGVALLLIATAVIGYRYEAGKAEQTKMLNIVHDLRQQYHESMNAVAQSGHGDFSESEKDVKEILSLDPANGHGIYYSGELKRIANRNLFKGDCVIPGALKSEAGELEFYDDDFNHYLDVERGLPAEERAGGVTSEACYARPSGYCSERTAWINHLLANDMYGEAMMSNDPMVQAEEFQRALGYANKAAELHQDEQHNPGFANCISTSSLIRQVQEKLKPVQK